jgi:hypothetical protein
LLLIGQFAAEVVRFGRFEVGDFAAFHQNLLLVGRFGAEIVRFERFDVGEFVGFH